MNNFLLIVLSSPIGAMALNCYSQSLLPSGSLPDRILTDDFPANADTASCSSDVKWCIQYYIQDTGTGTEYVTGGCQGEFLGRY
mmetsp:Transcript_33028/g.87666  ORF Transcript_33028/g.87666 Transcript_33028/m.87666 type:complete len:84 (-) Transcript_33028:619-870(-)